MDFWLNQYLTKLSNGQTTLNHTQLRKRESKKDIMGVVQKVLGFPTITTGACAIPTTVGWSREQTFLNLSFKN